VDKVEAVSALLQELSVRLDIQANNSREVFENVGVESNSERLLSRLREECGS